MKRDRWRTKRHSARLKVCHVFGRAKHTTKSQFSMPNVWTILAKCLNHIGDRMRHIGNSMRMLAAVQNWLQWYQKMICCGTVTKTVNNGMKYISWCEKVKGYERVLVNKGKKSVSWCLPRSRKASQTGWKHGTLRKGTWCIHKFRAIGHQATSIRLSAG